MSSIAGITSVTAQDYTTETKSSTESSDINFSDILADALKEKITETAVTGTAGAGTSGLGGYSALMGSSGSGGIEQMIVAASASGEVSDAQVALFMLCMMMQSNEDGDFSSLFGLMGNMLTQIQGDTGALRDTVMSSEYSPYILDTIDKNVFKTPTPSVTGTGKAITPTESWKPATPAVTSSEGNRSPEQLRAVIDQFNVETATRYEPFRNGYTYCNIFLWDVTAAMGCEIPHYVDARTGEPRYYPDIKGANEMGAIATEDWLVKHGEDYGWREVDAETAQRYANAGKAAVTTAGKVGHVQVVCPSKDGKYDSVRGVTVAQAGSKVTNYTHLSGIYSSSGMKNIKYFVHE